MTGHDATNPSDDAAGPRYRLALRAYPKDYRNEYGDEVVDTANELTDDRWSPRQARSLVASGLRTRARLASAGTSRGLWVDGVGLALILWLLLVSVPILAYAIGITGEVRMLLRPSAPVAVAASLIPAFVLTVTTRWPAAMTITAAGLLAVIADLLQGPVEPFGYQFAAITLSRVVVTATLAWWLAVRGDGRRVLSPAAAASVLAVLMGTAYLAGTPESAWAYAMVLLGLPAVGLTLVTLDPRPVIAATTIWLILAVNLIPTRLILFSGLDRASLVLALVVLTVLTIGVSLSRFGARRVTAEVRT